MAVITSFNTSGLLCSIRLNWVITGSDYTHTEIWRNTVDYLPSAELIANSYALEAIDPVQISTEYYYWIRLVDGGVAQSWYSLSGSHGQADQTMIALLNQLQTKISEAQLTDGLNSRIDGFVESGALIDFEQVNNKYDVIDAGLQTVDDKYVLIDNLLTTMLSDFGELNTDTLQNITDLQAYIDGKIADLNAGIVTVQNSISGIVTTEVGPFITMVQDLDTNVSDINQLLITLESTLSTQISDAFALINSQYTTIVNESSATAAKTDLLEADFSTLETNTNAAISTEQTARASGDSALATQISNLSASYTDFTNTVNADISDMQLVFTDETQAIAQQVTNFSAQFTTDLSNAEANFTNQITTLSNDTQALSQQVTNYTAQFTTDLSNAVATINTELTTLASEDVSLATLITQLDAKLVTDKAELEASILEEQTARVDEDSAIASQFTSLNTSINNNYAQINVHAQSIDGIQADWGVRTDVNGHVAGLKFINGPDGSDFTVTAQTFNIVNPATLNPIFEVDTVEQKVCFTGEVCFGSVLEEELGEETAPIPGADGQIITTALETSFSEPYCELLKMGNVTPTRFAGVYTEGCDYYKGDVVWVAHQVFLNSSGTIFYTFTNAYVVTKNHTFATQPTTYSRHGPYVMGLPPALNGLAETMNN